MPHNLDMQIGMVLIPDEQWHGIFQTWELTRQPEQLLHGWENLINTGNSDCL